MSTAKERSRRAYATKKKRMAEDPEYREGILEKQRVRERARRIENPDAVREANRKYREANREARLEYGRRQRREQPGAIRARERSWRDKNLERERAKGREKARLRRANDPEAARAAQRVWREQNREVVLEHQRRRRASVRGRHITSEQSQLAREWTEILKNDPCSYSRIPLACDHIDHIEPVARGGEHSWQNLTSSSAHANQQKHAASLLAYLRRRLDEAEASA